MSRKVEVPVKVSRAGLILKVLFGQYVRIKGLSCHPAALDGLAAGAGESGLEPRYAADGSEPFQKTCVLSEPFALPLKCRRIGG